MSTTERQILTPGETAQPAAAPAADAAPAVERKKPGPKPRAAAPAAAPAAGDDLDEFDGDELPPAPAPAPVAAPASAAEFTPEQQRLIAAMIASAVQASKAAQDPKTAAKLAAAANTAEKLPTQDEAKAMCDDQVARGTRPRPVLTPQGWYVHPESVRTVDHGVAKLSVG